MYFLFRVIFHNGVAVKCGDILGSDVAHIVETVESPAGSLELYDAIVIVIDSLGVVLLVSLVPQQGSVLVVKVKDGLSGKANAFKCVAVVKV
jgi:hypothetical protein